MTGVSEKMLRCSDSMLRKSMQFSGSTLKSSDHCLLNGRCAIWDHSNYLGKFSTHYWLWPRWGIQISLEAPISSSELLNLSFSQSQLWHDWNAFITNNPHGMNKTLETSRNWPCVHKVAHCFYFFFFWGMDMRFLRTALTMAKTAVYSLHKTSTREVSSVCPHQLTMSMAVKLKLKS